MCYFFRQHLIKKKAVKPTAALLYYIRSRNIKKKLYFFAQVLRNLILITTIFKQKSYCFVLFFPVFIIIINLYVV